MYRVLRQSLKLKRLLKVQARPSGPDSKIATNRAGVR